MNSSNSPLIPFRIDRSNVPEDVIEALGNAIKDHKKAAKLGLMISAEIARRLEDVFNSKTWRTQEFALLADYFMAARRQTKDRKTPQAAAINREAATIINFIEVHFDLIDSEMAFALLPK